MHDNDRPKSGSGFINGLLWGVAVGAGAAFLLGTPRGKKILSAIKDRGIESITEIQEMLEEEDALEEFEEASPHTKKSTEELSPELEDKEPEKASPLQQLTSTGRRFFRGSSRKN